MSTTTDASDVPPVKMRALCLHGFAQDGATFRGKIGALRKALKSHCEYVFLDAPHDVAGAFDGDAETFRGMDTITSATSSRAWFTSRENAEHGAKRSCDEGWTRPAMSKSYDGWNETVDAIRRLMATEGPFEGIIGFSQGATAAVAALASIEELRASVRFVVLVAGFEPLDETMLKATRAISPIPIPSLHAHGDQDKLVTRERMTQLASHFDESTREFFFHEGSHGVPTSLAKFAKAWITGVRERSST